MPTLESPPLLEVVLLSPHRDDAAFSCGLLAARLLQAGAVVHLVNVCTQSDYAPYLPADDEPRTMQVSRTRRAEDVAFLQALNDTGGKATTAAMTDLDWSDSPLRLGVATDRVRDVVDVPPAEIAFLADAFAPWRNADAVLAPLAIGNHIDHRLVCAAACRAFSPDRLGFYQDLPYACWMSPDEREATAAALQQQYAGAPLLQWNHAVATPAVARLGRKRQYCLCYASQIAPDLADLMEADAVQLYQGEQMHLPEVLAGRLTALLREGT